MSLTSSLASSVSVRKKLDASVVCIWFVTRNSRSGHDWDQLGPFIIGYWCSGFVSRSMNRLASFKGPSSPSSSPARAQPPSAPPSPSRLSETTHHRKVRALLRELQTTAQTWDNLVLIDGLTAAQSLIDTRTELECVLIMFPTPFNDESLLVMTSLCLQLRAFLLWG